jgi:predicted TPR repeat methyltransferase
VTTTPTSSSTSALYITIAEGVEFDTIAREWRCKWSPEGDKASLIAAQQALVAVADDLKQVDGVKSVERIVCGGCLDFKVITSLSADKFGAWEQQGFAPEKEFLEMLEAIDGITVIETQTYTVRAGSKQEYTSEYDVALFLEKGLSERHDDVLVGTQCSYVLVYQSMRSYF